IRHFTDEGDGTYTAALVALTPGLATVRATVNGAQAPAAVAVQFVDWPAGNGDFAVTTLIRPRYSGVGDYVTVTHQVTNTSSRPAGNMSFTSHLPGGLQYVSSGGVQASASAAAAAPMSQGMTAHTVAAASEPYDPISHAARWTIPGLAPGASFTVSYTAAVGDVPEGTELTVLATLSAGADVVVASGAASILVGHWPQLTVEKLADAKEASVGSFVGYGIRIANDGSVASHETRVVDTLPEGFAYVDGSTTVNGRPGPEPHVDGRMIVWDVGDVEPGDRLEVAYRAFVSVEALHSDGINRVVVEGRNPAGLYFDTDPVTARVAVQPGLFGTLGTIVGTVYYDADGDGRKSPDEPGVPGVMLMTDDGQWVVTDEQGRYSMAGLYPGIRAVKAVVPAAGTGSSGGQPAENGDRIGHGDGTAGGGHAGDSQATASVGHAGVGASAGAWRPLESHFVLVPVSGVAVHNVGLQLEPDGLPASTSRAAGPPA